MVGAHIELILLITGLATTGALTLVIVPDTMIRLLFGQSLSDPLGVNIARHWGLLLFLVGGLIVYAAHRPEIRVPTLIVASVEKVAFAVGVLTSPFRRRPAVIGLALVDLGMAAMYVTYLAGM
jgi:hypothetical protein